MVDGIIKGTGNSRYLKSVSDFLALYPNYESFARALIDGTLPIDLNGINSSGWITQGTPLNKANLLADETASSLGLNSDANVDGALRTLAANDAAAPLVKIYEYTTSEETSQVDIDISSIDVSEFLEYKVITSFVGDAAFSRPVLSMRINNLGSGSYYGLSGTSDRLCSFSIQSEAVLHHVPGQRVWAIMHHVILSSGKTSSTTPGYCTVSNVERINSINVFTSDGSNIPVGTRFMIYALR